MRIFVGIKVEAPPELPRIKCELGNVYIKWVKESNYHLTLLFIGSVNPLLIKDISLALHKIVPRYAPFTIQIKGAGTFQKRRSSGVLWLGVEDNSTLTTLHNEIYNALSDLLPHFRKQHAGYTPHISLARIKDKEELYNFKLQLDRLNVNMQQRVSEILLYESASTAHGVEYRVLEQFSLK